MSIVDDAARIARRLGPLGGLTARGIEISTKGVQTTERLALRALRARLEAVAPTPELTASRQNGRGPDPSPAQLMAQLLDRSLAQDTTAAQRAARVAVLSQLLPDEARIIAALAEGRPAPLIHVLRRAGGNRILENASYIGRAAALTLPSQTPTYVTHLRQLGLVETGPEDPDNKHGYELLMADRAVRAALKEGELSKLPARVVKRTLVLSPQGRALWQACTADDDA